MSKPLPLFSGKNFKKLQIPFLCRVILHNIDSTEEEEEQEEVEVGGWEGRRGGGRRMISGGLSSRDLRGKTRPQTIIEIGPK